MAGALGEYSFAGAVEYHYGAFPPNNLDYARLHRPLAAASAALARFDALLQTLQNKELLLAPLRSTEAVVSSRIEGTIATLDEVLKIQADTDEEVDDFEQYRLEAIEVYFYTRAMRHAQSLINDGLPICARLIKEAHSRLLQIGRGADKSPGNFKDDQNYVVDKGKKSVLFVPINIANLNNGISKFERFVNSDDMEPLTQTAISHLEFEALHPFKDGNGRIGRMIIPLILWQKGLIDAPYFYVSNFFEDNRDEYIQRLRAVSQNQEWTEWVIFFLAAIESQAKANIGIANRIIALYTEMKDRFRDVLSSQWSGHALDYVFEKAVFRNSSFTKGAGIPPQSAHRITRSLTEHGLLTVLEPASGRRAALFAFNPLLEVVRA